MDVSLIGGCLMFTVIAISNDFACFFFSGRCSVNGNKKILMVTIFFNGEDFLSIKEDDNHCDYVLGPSLMTWSNAKAWCEGQKSMLYMQSELGQWGDLKQSNITFVDGESFWIGLSWSETKNVFQWTDGSSITADYWSDGQPNRTMSGYNCVQQSSYDGRWETANCDTESRFVCQDGAVTEERATRPPRLQARRDGNAVMWEGLLKGFACAGGLILAVAVIMHLPCCRNWVNKKEAEVFKRQQATKMRERPTIEQVAAFDQPY